jgi:hypothetical protein
MSVQDIILKSADTVDSGSSGDPNWSSVSLLLTGDTLTDSSSNPKTITITGNTQVSTGTKKYGAGSLYFDGTGDYLTVSSNSELQLSTGNFTIECWINTTDTKAYSGIISDNSYHTTTNNFQLMLNYPANKLTIWNAGNVLCTSATSVNTGSWIHIALVRTSSTNVTLYINGVADASATIASTLAFGTGPLIIGSQNGFLERTLVGYIDDIRITKGLARYTSNFTPPTAALPTSRSSGSSLNYSPNTKAILHFEGANGSTTITDDAGNVFACYGNASISTSFSKF